MQEPPEPNTLPPEYRAIAERVLADFGLAIASVDVVGHDTLVLQMLVNAAEPPDVRLMLTSGIFDTLSPAEFEQVMRHEGAEAGYHCWREGTHVPDRDYAILDAYMQGAGQEPDLTAQQRQQRRESGYDGYATDAGVLADALRKLRDSQDRAYREYPDEEAERQDAIGAIDARIERLTALRTHEITRMKQK